MTEIIQAEFITSAPNISMAPENDRHNEIVFVARSNAGKSSLLNAIANHKNLAKTSSTPGKTRLINFFKATLIDRETKHRKPVYLVDLPGFGYAKVSKSIKEEWGQSLTDFILKRDQIRLFIHLVDSRHPDLAIDREVASFLDSYCNDDQVVMRVFTKIDKLNQKEIGILKRNNPGVLCISSVKKRGISQLIQMIYDFIEEEGDVGDNVS